MGLISYTICFPLFVLCSFVCLTVSLLSRHGQYLGIISIRSQLGPQELSKPLEGLASIMNIMIKNRPK